MLGGLSERVGMPFGEKMGGGLVVSSPGRLWWFIRHNRYEVFEESKEAWVKDHNKDR